MDPFVYTKQIPSISEWDVAVVGSGSAGAVAAIAAGRTGARTLLIERLPFLGGNSTAVLDTFYGFYTPGAKPQKIVGGIPDEVVACLKEYQVCLERPNTYGAGTGVTYHPEYLKVTWEKLVRQAGTQIWLHAALQDAIVKEQRVEGLIVATREGLRLVKAQIFVDASGDADLCHFAGLGYEVAGENSPAQTLTTTFKMCNVDLPRRRALSKENFHQLMAEAAESGRYRLPRKEGSDHITPIPGMTATVMTRLPSFRRNGETIENATRPEFLTEAEIEGRLQALEYVRFLQERVPGYEQAQLASFSVQAGIRETRRVLGLYRLSREDVLGAKQFDDQVGLCGAPIEDHREEVGTRWHYLPEGECVGIPFRTLLARDAVNVLVCGRCFSATHDAHASVRSMAQCMAMGQAAGTAAGLASAAGIFPRDLILGELLHHLRRDGAILKMER